MTAPKSSLKKAIFVVVFLFIIGGILVYSGALFNTVNAVSTSITLSAKTTPDKLECKMTSGATFCGQVSLLASVPFPTGYNSLFGYFQYSTDGKSWKKINQAGIPLTSKVSVTTQSASVTIIAMGTYQYKFCLFTSITSTKSIRCSNTISLTTTAAPLSVSATVTPIQAYCDNMGKCEPVNIKITGTDITYGISNIILYSIGNDGVTKTKETEQPCSSKKECSLEKSVSKPSPGGYKYFAEVYNTHKTTSNLLGDKATKDIMVQMGKDDPPTAVGNIVIVPDKGEIEANDKINITAKAKDDVGLTIGKIAFSKMGHEAEFREIPGFGPIDVKGLKEFNFSWNNEFPGWKVDADKNTSGLYNIKITFRDTNPNNIEGYSVASGAITIVDEFVAKLRKLGISNDDIGTKSGPSGSILGYMTANGITTDEMMPVVDKLINLAKDTDQSITINPLSQIKGLLVAYRGVKSNFISQGDISKFLKSNNAGIINKLDNVEIIMGASNKAVENVIRNAPGWGCLVGNLFGSVTPVGKVAQFAPGAQKVVDGWFKAAIEGTGKFGIKVYRRYASSPIALNNPRSESDAIQKMVVESRAYLSSDIEAIDSYYLFRSIGILDVGGNIIKSSITSPKAGVIMLNGYSLDSKLFHPFEKVWFLRLAATQGIVLPTVTSQKPIGGSSKTVDLSSQYQPLIDFYEKQAQSGLYIFASNQISVDKPIDLDAPEITLDQCQ